MDVQFVNSLNSIIEKVYLKIESLNLDISINNSNNLKMSQAFYNNYKNVVIF